VRINKELGGSMARSNHCKKGMHRYSDPGEIGGGIARRTCVECGMVQIDLSGTGRRGDTNLFTEPKLATMFQVEALLAKVGPEIVTPSRSFGEAPAGRRRPAGAFG
jgi:hypothetical protein